MLWQKAQTPCVLRVKVRTEDGEGGHTGIWSNGEKFTAAIVKASDFAARIAEKQTNTREYIVTTERALGFHDIFRRTSDGQSFRVISSAADSAPPTCAGFRFYQFKAEVWKED